MSITFLSKNDLKKCSEFSNNKSARLNLNIFNVKGIVFLFLLGLMAAPQNVDAKPPLKKIFHKKFVKTTKRNAFDIDFGTFDYESAVVRKKTIFIG